MTQAQQAQPTVAGMRSRRVPRPSEAVTRLMRRPGSGALVGAVFVYLFFVVFAGPNGFVTANATATWLNQAAELVVVAIPIGVLMIAGEFDLSIAAVIGMAALTVSIAAGYYDVPLPVAILCAFVLAATVGLVNGLVTIVTGVPSFIVTLASLLAVGGGSLALTRIITTTTNVSLDVEGPVRTIFAGTIGQFRAPILIAAGLILLASHILTRTVFGNWVMATGGEPAVARSAGVPTDRVKVTLFVTSSLGAALLGVIQAVQYNGGQVGQGQNFIFDAIVASVIGGVLLQGGYGSAVGVAWGAVTFAVVSVGIYYTGWNSDLAQVFIGGLVLIAVLANNYLRRIAVRD